MPGTNSKINNLYEQNQNYLARDMKNELRVKAEKKWGEEGYKGNDKEKEKWGVETIKIESIEGTYNNKNSNEKGYSYYENNRTDKKPKKIVEEEDPNKKKLMQDLFGGIDGNSQPEKKITNKNKNEHNKEKNVKNNITQNKNSLNLFEGLTQNFGNKNQNNNILNNLINTTSNNPFTPYNINTEKFGELWESFPDEVDLSINSNINSPQKYHEIIKSKGNFSPIDIINNEAISAAYYKNQIVLVHADIENNQINFLVKCQNNLFNKEVSDIIMKLFS